MPESPASASLWNNKTLWRTPEQSGVNGGAYKEHVITLSKNVEHYNLPYVAIAGIGMAFLNGVLCTVELSNGNRVRLTEYTPAELDDDDILTLFIII